jgi:RNA polymerase sigma-70 factor (ECF subfamily)
LALDQPDPDVLRLARHGDERAFALIVRQYQTPLYNYIALPGFDSRCQFTTWLFQVAKHRVVDELRARERRGRPPVDIESVPHLSLALAPTDSVEEMDVVWRAIGALNVDLKMALLLRDVVGLSYAEIADALETTLATVKWRIYKAREIVAGELAREGFGPAGRRPRRSA